MRRIWTTNLVARMAILALLVAAATCPSARADSLFKITEAYAGVDGEDGTTDWFELTNFGGATANIGGFYYDDDSADPTKNYQLPSFDVAPGESVVVLIEALDGDIATFKSFWGSNVDDVQVGITVPGGGSLGQGGDAVWVFDGNTAGAPVIDSLIFSGPFGNKIGTIEDITGVGPLANSQTGVHGAFESAGTSGIGKLVGSPGVNVPEPASVVLALTGLVGLLGLRRRPWQD